MPDYDIALTKSQPSTPQLPPGTKLISVDRGVVHAQLQSNNMHLVVIPTGKTGSFMMRRVCVGGSRLEDASCAGAAHVIEHMDFRNVDWLKFGGMIKNAATSKLYIEHEGYGLLHPTFQHVEKEFEFQRQTMMGQNLQNLKNEQILHEINNVRDEGRFNSQKGSGFRAVVMEMEKMLLPRVWSSNANVLPTIGTDTALSNLKTQSDIQRMHNMFRGPQRTFMVVAGPVHVNKTLQAMYDTFHDIPRNDSLLRSIPTAINPSPRRAQFSSISLDSGNRFVAVGGMHGSYNSDTDVMLIMQHLVGVLGSQPMVQQNGVNEVALYFEPSKETGVFSLVAKVTPNGDETIAIARAHEVLQQCVVNPLLQFNNDHLLNALLKQYRSSLQQTLQSGPQKVATLAVQGILACEKPSLAWHVDDRFSAELINSTRVRNVASQMFHPQYMGIVHCTAQSKSKPNLRFIQAMPEHEQACVTLNLTPDTSHLHRNKAVILKSKYVNVGEKYDELQAKEDVLSATHDTLGSVAYNTTAVQPLNKRLLVCNLGTPESYGGWAQASLAVAAMNVAAKLANCPMVKFELENQTVVCSVESSESQPFLSAPLLTTLQIGLALGDSTVSSPDLQQLRTIVPQQALALALDTAKKWYEDPSKLAMAQARTQMCNMTDAGFVPHNMSVATQLLGANHQFVHEYLPKLCMQKPALAGTNISRKALHDVAQQIVQLQQKVPQAPKDLLTTKDVMAYDKAAPHLAIVKRVEGLHTFPYVASIQASKALRRKDRASLLVSNQVMVGGMGAHYTHDIRQQGVSYRPSGGIQLSWQMRPILTLKATFKDSVMQHGIQQTKQNLQDWAQGQETVFSSQNVSQAKRAIREQVLLSCMDFEAQKYNLLALLDANKFSTSEIIRAVDKVQPVQIQRTLNQYFGQQNSIYESLVQDDDDHHV